MSIPTRGEWLLTPQGQYILGWEQVRYDEAVADIFGFNAVQIGMIECDLLRANRMPLRFRCGEAGGADLLSDLHHLPLPSASVDLVVMPHVLEFSQHPHQILREVERVLVPDGHIVITGFNPHSLWGTRRWLASSYAGFPWTGRYLGVRRLKDWLTLLGFEIEFGKFGCYAPAIVGGKWLRRWRFLEFAGDRWWPIGGAVYIVQAVKRVHGTRLITPVWRERKARSKSLAPVVQRTDGDNDPA